MDPGAGVKINMDRDLYCCFGRALVELRHSDPAYEHTLEAEHISIDDVTLVTLSWIGDQPETPAWLLHVDYVVERRWERHFLQCRLKGHIEHLGFFFAPEIKQLARDYLKQRYGR